MLRAAFQISFLEAEKADLERRLDRQKSTAQSQHLLHHRHLQRLDVGGGGGDVVDHVRAQVPLRASPVAVSNVSEQTIRVKLLEQENERYLRKIKGLESQLAELERVSRMPLMLRSAALKSCRSLQGSPSPLRLLFVDPFLWFCGLIQ